MTVGDLVEFAKSLPADAEFEDVRRGGEQSGYPPCCVAFYTALIPLRRMEVPAVVAYWELELSRSKPGKGYVQCPECLGVPLDTELMNEDERPADIDYWWSGGFPGAFAAERHGRPMEPRLFGAFRRVLLAMPGDDFERFMEMSPTVVCQPVIHGAAYSYYLPVVPGAKAVRLYVLYFRPDLEKFSDEKLARLVAHETAHLILGHADEGRPTVGEGDVHAEEAADQKAESWGFKGAYSREHRRRLARQHAASKQKRQ